MRAGVILMGSIVPLAATHATVTPCSEPGERALTARRFDDAARAFEAAAQRAECRPERERLLFNAAYALHEVARRAQDDTWCRARDAYRPLRSASDADIAGAAAEGAELAGQHCGAFEAGRRRGTAEAPSPWWLTGSGIGALAVGGVMLGFGVEAWQEAGALRAELDEGDGTVDEVNRLKRREGGATAFLIGGGALVAVGATLLVAGLVAGDADEPSSPGARLQVGPSGASLTVHFE